MSGIEGYGDRYRRGRSGKECGCTHRAGAVAKAAPVSRPSRQLGQMANRGSLPGYLKRCLEQGVEVVIEPEMSCACGAARRVIGEEVSERLDIVPAQFRMPAQFQMIVIRRRQYARRSCEGEVTQAPALAHIIAQGIRLNR